MGRPLFGDTERTGRSWVQDRQEKGLKYGREKERHWAYRAHRYGDQLVHRLGRVRHHRPAGRRRLPGSGADRMAHRGRRLLGAGFLVEQPHREAQRSARHLLLRGCRLGPARRLHLRLGLLAVGVAGQRGLRHDDDVHHRLLLPRVFAGQHHSLHHHCFHRDVGAHLSGHSRRRERCLP